MFISFDAIYIKKMKLIMFQYNHTYIFLKVQPDILNVTTQISPSQIYSIKFELHRINMYI